MLSVGHVDESVSKPAANVSTVEPRRLSHVEVEHTFLDLVRMDPKAEEQRVEEDWTEEEQGPTAAIRV